MVMSRNTTRGSAPPKAESSRENLRTPSHVNYATITMPLRNYWHVFGSTIVPRQIDVRHTLKAMLVALFFFGKGEYYMPVKLPLEADLPDR